LLRADALDGGRAAGLGEVAPAVDHPDAAELVLKDVPDGGVAWLDGAAARRTGTAFPTRPGPHVVVVSLEGSPVWARWVELSAGRSALAVSAPSIGSCSARDLARARFVGDAVVAEPVRCDEWIAAWPASSGGSVHVVRCGHGECGPSVDWGANPAWSWAPPEARNAEGGGWPVWATWALVGAGAAAAVLGGAVLASGALQSPGATRYVSGGIRSE
jgi:hypothetical protein